MSLPILLPNAVKAYRGDPLSFSIVVKKTRKNPQIVPLSAYGTTWASQIRTSSGGPLAATFDIDQSQVDNGILGLYLDGVSVRSLADPFYWFDIQVTGGTLSPLTVFLGKIQVDGDITDA